MEIKKIKKADIEKAFKEVLNTDSVDVEGCGLFPYNKYNKWAEVSFEAKEYLSLDNLINLFLRLGVNQKKIMVLGENRIALFDCEVI